MPTTLNTLTGKVKDVPKAVAEHAIIGRYLKVVPEGTKPLVPGMFKPGTVEEYDAAHSEKATDTNAEDK